MRPEYKPSPVTAELPIATPLVIDTAGLAALIDLLVADGRTVVAPTVRNGAIALAEIRGVDELPSGWGDVQTPARYSLRRRDDAALFGYAAPAESWKRLLFPAREVIWRARRTDDDRFVVEAAAPRPLYAFVGARACEVEAIAIQDRVFLHGAHPEPIYCAARDEVLVIAVTCSDPASTCFCTSMGTGPRVAGHADVVLTEIVEDGAEAPWYTADARTEIGAALLRRVPHRAATPYDLEAAEMVAARAEQRMGRAMPQVDLHSLLETSQEHPRWDDVAQRCLSCTNCTLVCPTCFCSSVEDVTDLTGTEARRERRWASCFELDHSYLHGGSVRTSTRARYRQWLTHKLSTWFDQFGTSGCVGCGRCITWCPAGIDITEEIRAIAQAAESEVAQ